MRTYEEIKQIKKENKCSTFDLMDWGLITNNEHHNFVVDSKMKSKRYKKLSTSASYLEERFYLLVKHCLYTVDGKDFLIFNNVKLKTMRGDFRNLVIDFLFVLNDYPYFLCVECDSDKHHHENKGQIYSDKEKDQMIVAQTGIPVVRFTYKDITERPSYVLDILVELSDSYSGNIKGYYTPLDRLEDEKVKEKIINLLKL